MLSPERTNSGPNRCIGLDTKSVEFFLVRRPNTAALTAVAGLRETHPRQAGLASSNGGNWSGVSTWICRNSRQLLPSCSKHRRYSEKFL